VDVMSFPDFPHDYDTLVSLHWAPLCYYTLMLLHYIPHATTRCLLPTLGAYDKLLQVLGLSEKEAKELGLPSRTGFNGCSVSCAAGVAPLQGSRLHLGCMPHGISHACSRATCVMDRETRMPAITGGSVVPSSLRSA
jgi:hypothetical protein